MAIISFWSISRKETGQSLSMAAVMTSMAVDHNMKILGISTEFNDTTLESGFFDVEKEKKRMIELQKSRQLINNIPGMEGMGMPITGGKLDSGIEGVIKIINSKRITDQIVKDYTKVVFKDRLDILPSPSAANYDVYKETVSKAKDVVELADKEYNMVFVDVDKDLPKEYARDILSISDIVMINLTQGTKQLEEFLKLKKTDDLFGDEVNNLKNQAREIEETMDSFFESNPAATSYHSAYSAAASSVPTLQVPVQAETRDGEVSEENDQDGYSTVTIG